MANKLPPLPIGVVPGSGYWNDWIEKLRSYANSFADAFPWANITGTPTTLAGYGITNAQKGIQFKNEATPLGGTDAVELAFVGAGVTATRVGDAITVTIEGDAVAVYNIELDEFDATTTYFGEAAEGSALSAAVWRIRRYTTTGPDLSGKWADGNSNFDNVWNDRTTLTYT